MSEHPPANKAVGAEKSIPEGGEGLGVTSADQTAIIPVSGTQTGPIPRRPSAQQVQNTGRDLTLERPRPSPVKLQEGIERRWRKLSSILTYSHQFG